MSLHQPLSNRRLSGFPRLVCVFTRAENLPLERDIPPIEIAESAIWLLVRSIETDLFHRAPLASSHLDNHANMHETKRQAVRDTKGPAGTSQERKWPI